MSKPLRLSIDWTSALTWGLVGLVAFTVAYLLGSYVYHLIF